MARSTASRPGVKVTFDTAGLERALGQFLRRAEVASAAVGEQLGRQVTADVARRLEGHSGPPRRIDTGALQSAWRAARPEVVRRGVRWRARWKNPMPYAALVEHGTAKMAPGLHLASALDAHRAEGLRALSRAIRSAWRG